MSKLLLQTVHHGREASSIEVGFHKKKTPNFIRLITKRNLNVCYFTLIPASVQLYLPPGLREEENTVYPLVIYLYV